MPFHENQPEILGAGEKIEGEGEKRDYSLRILRRMQGEDLEKFLRLWDEFLRTREPNLRLSDTAFRSLNLNNEAFELIRRFRGSELRGRREERLQKFLQELVAFLKPSFPTQEEAGRVQREGHLPGEYIVTDGRVPRTPDLDDYERAIPHKEATDALHRAWMSPFLRTSDDDPEE